MNFFGGLKTVWMVVMFDLPTETAEDRRRYAQFRKVLLKDGFWMMQFSVYGRHCPSDENAEVHEKRVVWALPPKGNVRIIKVTEKQFARMKTFYGKAPTKTEEPPLQLSFF
ncbi:MAG: CRISPR-associated endonuclease Cas2 [Pyrinomonadaceae bacterium]|nr:CRISPR-associated endonuclease Cas2 [Pyrinomonadaceae bacterium]